jgi:hypothetical protein
MMSSFSEHVGGMIDVAKEQLRGVGIDHSISGPDCRDTAPVEVNGVVRLIRWTLMSKMWNSGPFSLRFN